MRFVITRPLPEGERTAALLRSRGHDTLVAPLMRVENIAADLGSEWAAVIVTSAHAIGALADAQREKLRTLPLFAVGRRSADAARQAEFSNVASADGAGSDLVELITARCKGATLPLLYLAGEDRAFDLTDELAGMGIAAKTVVVYRAVTLPYPPALSDALRSGSVDAVLHFSRRSAENYLAGGNVAGIVEHARAARHFCLSAQVAEPLRAAGAITVVAAQSDEAALLELVESV
ncbi:MAG: uroporphyrinogen-III synthase [Pseudolabrys sp.]